MKTYVITGATGAVGKVTALELAKAENKLILVGRDKNKLDAVVKELKSASNNQQIETVIADFSDLNSVKKAAAEIKSRVTSLDGLINIAAAYRAKRELTRDKLEYMFGINHMSVFVLTTELLGLINSTPGAKILTVSAPSGTVLNFDDLQGEKKFSALNAFGASKSANHLFTYALSRRLPGIGTSALVFHPGLVKSDLTREMPLPLRLLFNLISKKPDKAGYAIAKLMSSNKLNDVNGKFFDSNFKELKQPGTSGNQELQEKLWKVSEGIVNGK